MHKLGIIHLDLHLANIMYYQNDVKIIDFDSCIYKNYAPNNYNFYTQEYLEDNEIGESVDIYNFNIDTFACLHNINWDDVFKFSRTLILDSDKRKVWEKTMKRKKLTYDDFLIDRY